MSWHWAQDRVGRCRLFDFGGRFGRMLVCWPGFGRGAFVGHGEAWKGYGMLAWEGLSPPRGCFVSPERSGSPAMSWGRPEMGLFVSVAAPVLSVCGGVMSGAYGGSFCVFVPRRVFHQSRGIA